VRVARRREDLEHAVLEAEEGDIEGATAEVVDGDDLGRVVAGGGCRRSAAGGGQGERRCAAGRFGAGADAVGQGRGGGLVDDAQDLKAGGGAGVAGGLALGVVEVRGDGDDGLADGPAERGLGTLAEGPQDRGGDLLGRVVATLDLDLEGVARAAVHFVGEEGQLAADVVEALADQPLHGINGGAGVLDGLGPRGPAEAHLRRFAGSVRDDAED
jgi:hypothetical protein